jgi:hypothetical protein
MPSGKQGVILGLALLGALTCVVLLALGISARPPSSSSPRVTEPRGTDALEISPPLWIHVRPGWPEDDYPREPIRPGEPPRTLPPLLLDRDPGMPGGLEGVKEIFPVGK